MAIRATAMNAAMGRGNRAVGGNEWVALATWRFRSIAHGLFCLYLVDLLIGSVILAWHYAVDGYAAIVGTWAIWWAVGRALDWRSYLSNNLETVTTKRP